MTPRRTGPGQRRHGTDRTILSTPGAEGGSQRNQAVGANEAHSRAAVEVEFQDVDIEDLTELLSDAVQNVSDCVGLKSDLPKPLIFAQWVNPVPDYRCIISLRQAKRY